MSDRHIRTVQLLTLFVLACIVAGVALNSTGLFDPARDAAAKVRQLAATLPTLFYLAAIWMIARTHAAMSRGEAVEAALATLLERLGACLFLGGLARVFGELWLIKIVLGTTGSWAWFDTAAITLGCVGLLMIALARPLRDAARTRAELAEIL